MCWWVQWKLLAGLVGFSRWLCATATYLLDTAADPHPSGYQQAILECSCRPGVNGLLLASWLTWMTNQAFQTDTSTNQIHQ